MELTIKETMVGDILISMRQTEYGIYYVAAYPKHDDNLFGYPIAENFTSRKSTANSYYYYLRRKYK